MSGRRLYDNATVERVKAAVRDGRRIREVAADFGMSPSTVSNMMRGRIYRPLDEVKAEQRSRAELCRVAAQAKAEVRRARRAEDMAAVPQGAVERAKAEVRSGKPLVVESLEQRLERLVPGARIEVAPHCGVDSCQVWRGESVLATGASKREAIDRAVFLWGQR